MSQFRWRLAEDDGGQPALFAEEELVDRHVGSGEYAGLEFLHVNARRIITTVPPASRVPFRHTINAYRGCSHACVYCLSGDTRVLLVDGRTRPIGAMTVGDQVVGTQRVGRYRRFVATSVLDKWSTTRLAFRVTLEDGTELLTSGDHRFLTDRGWKHVVGTEQGRRRRPHLTVSNRLLGVGAFPAGADWKDDYRHGYLCGMVRGDAHVGHYTYERGGRSTEVHRFRLALADSEPLARTRAFLEAEQVTTHSFVFSEATPQRRGMTAIRTQSRGAVVAIESLIDWPLSSTDEWAAGFLAGMYDAEGSLGGVIRISNADHEVLAWTRRAFIQLGFSCVLEPPRSNGVQCVRLVGGLPEILRFVLTVDPATTRKRTILGRALKTTGSRRVVSITATGVEMPMFDITTGTGDFIAEGVVSHNCFARPTHVYLGLGLGADFDTKLVVKVNAVERLRAELASPRWAGEPIAMGTNTDPYQRCEAKYRLTRGIIEVLGQAANPFSILTKSTLILGDLDRLKAAADRTDVGISFSIATLDESVWRATEPGTPHPLRRVDALAKLSEAGLRCGVLLAPVLPELSDSDDQLRAVVAACVEAGATSVTALALHLRPGVREHFMSWLAASRPDLLGRYQELFARGAYQPKAAQQALSNRVRAMVADARGLPVPPTGGHRVKPNRRPLPRPREAPDTARQLDLGW